MQAERWRKKKNTAIIALRRKHLLLLAVGSEKNGIFSKFEIASHLAFNVRIINYNKLHWTLLGGSMAGGVETVFFLLSKEWRKVSAKAMAADNGTK